MNADHLGNFLVRLKIDNIDRRRPFIRPPALGDPEDVFGVNLPAIRKEEHLIQRIGVNELERKIGRAHV